jgi:hypothetical protein
MRSALETAYGKHSERRAARDWRGLADCFAADARYFDPIFGWYEGREAIRDFLEGAMAGLADRVFEDVWHIAEGDRLVIYWRCGTPGEAAPEAGEGLYHGMSSLRYAGDGLWAEQMDIYDREQARSSRSRAGGE